MSPWVQLRITLLALPVLAATPARGQARFAATTPVIVPPVLGAHGPGPRGLAVGDFNGDGKPDIVSFFWDTQGGSGEVRLFLGAGDGSFRFQPQPPNPNGYTGCPFSAVGDVNGDGKDDLVCRFCANIYVLLGSADGTWHNVPSSVILPGIGTENATGGPILLGDANHDRKLDLLGMAGGLSRLPMFDQVSLDLGLGDGTFVANTPIDLSFLPIGLLDYQRSFALADLHGTGRPDLVVTDPMSKRLFVFANQGNGAFQMSPQSYPAPYGQIFTGDFNGDHRTDLAIADFYGNTIQVYLGNGEGTLQAPILVNAGPQGCVGTFGPNGCTPGFGSGPQQLFVADFNGDGSPDIAYLSRAPNDGLHLSLLMGRQGGRLAGPFTYPITPQDVSPQYALAVADFNGDGLPDLAVQTQDGFQVWLNTTPKGMNAGDVNGDGKVTVGDAVLALRFALGLLTPTAEQAARAEVTGGSTVSVADVVVILRWAIEQLNPP